MFRPLLERVRAEASGERALESVRAISRFHRVQASPGYDQAAEWLTQQLTAMGRAVETEMVRADGETRHLGYLMPEGWECSRGVATLIDGDRRERLCDYAAEKLSLILRSRSGRGRHRIVAVEDGSEAAHYEGVDVRGAMVLTSGPVHRVHELAVVQRGAVGLLADGRRLVPPVRDAFDDPDALNYTSFWWSGAEPRGLGFVVSARHGRRLRERLAAGAGLELEFDVDARAFATEMPLVSTLFPGEGAGEILVVAHLCHPQPSANDNASGAAAALECARVLSVMRARGELDDRGPGIRFLWVPELTGTYAWVDADPARARGLVAAINLDMVGESQDLCGSTLLIEQPPCFAASFAEELLGRVRREAVDWVTSYSGPGHYSMTRMAEVPYSGGSDHVVFTDPLVGVPCPMLIQWPDRYYHTSHDTPDKTDPASLELAVRCAAGYAAFLASAGEPERRWLLEAVGRGARRRALAAVDAADPARRLEREARSGSAALASLARLGVEPERLHEAKRGFDEFLSREARMGLADPWSEGPPLTGRNARPRRILKAPLHSQRHLLPGFREWPEEERERWHRLDRSIPEAQTLAELAWFCCDGRRTIDDIAREVWLETGRHEPDHIEAFFDAAERAGLCRPATADDPRPADGARSAGR
jgi:hypothetical protein